jgi:hypothetical protein
MIKVFFQGFKTRAAKKQLEIKEASEKRVQLQKQIDQLILDVTSKKRQNAE